MRDLLEVLGSGTFVGALVQVLGAPVLVLSGLAGGVRLVYRALT